MIPPVNTWNHWVHLHDYQVKRKDVSETTVPIHFRALQRICQQTNKALSFLSKCSLSSVCSRSCFSSCLALLFSTNHLLSSHTTLWIPEWTCNTDHTSYHTNKPHTIFKQYDRQDDHNHLFDISNYVHHKRTTFLDCIEVGNIQHKRKHSMENE